MTFREGTAPALTLRSIFEGARLQACRNLDFDVAASAAEVQFFCSPDLRLLFGSPDFRVFGCLMIAIVDYQAANLASVQKAIAHLGVESQITGEPEIVLRADGVILPGVGHFSTMQRLQDSGLREAIFESINEGVPFLGICVGMQWLFAGSTEAPEVPGLGLFQGMCEHFPAAVKSPHVGWNDFEVRGQSTLFRAVPRDASVYFTHSYRAPVAEGVVATTVYGTPFAAAVERGNVFGVQFHPEKSSAAGIQILKNFCEVAC